MTSDRRQLFPYLFGRAAKTSCPFTNDYPNNLPLLCLECPIAGFHCVVFPLRNSKSLLTQIALYDPPRPPYTTMYVKHAISITHMPPPHIKAVVSYSIQSLQCYCVACVCVCVCVHVRAAHARACSLMLLQLYTCIYMYMYMHTGWLVHYLHGSLMDAIKP